MKKTLKIFSIILLAALISATLFSLAGCAKDDNPNDDNDNDNQGENKQQLKVGMECGYIPFNYTQIDDSNGAVKISNADGYANGYDVMIAKKIAESLDMELVIVKYEWEALISAVLTGSLDFIIAGMSPTAERKETIDFSDAYYESQLVIVVRKDGNYATATSLADFSGATIVAQQGTFHDEALEEQGPAYGITRGTPMATFPDMTAALSAGTIDGYVAEEPGAIADCAATEGLTYIRLTNNGTGFTVTAEDTQIAVGIKKGSDLTAQVNAALAQISSAERNEMMEKAIALATGSNAE